MKIETLFHIGATNNPEQLAHVLDNIKANGLEDYIKIECGVYREEDKDGEYINYVNYIKLIIPLDDIQLVNDLHKLTLSYRAKIFEGVDRSSRWRKNNELN